MKINSLFLIAVTTCFISCNGEQNTTATTENTNETEQVNASENSVDTVEANVPEIKLKEKNQINDYAEYFLQGKIKDKSEDMNYENGDMHYYEILDIANGYCRVSGMYEGWYEMAVWRMENGNDLIGMFSAGCGPVCEYSIHFYEVNADSDKEVTNDVLPMKEIEAHAEKMKEQALQEDVLIEGDMTGLKFIIPQKGTSMDVYLSINSNELEFPIITLSWDKKKFNISKKHSNIPGI